MQAELQPLLELTQRVGNDPLLTQASTGNSSAKLDGVLWIKASGRWMADAMRDDILHSFEFGGGSDGVPAAGMWIPPTRYPSASLETAMHAALPHRVVLHVHCVNTIAWAVRNDAPIQLQQAAGRVALAVGPLRSVGLALVPRDRARSIRLPRYKPIRIRQPWFGHRCGKCKDVEDLLNEVRERLANVPRQGHPADYAALMEICRDSPWDLPDDDGVHALGTDLISQAILAGGLLYPCQAIFFGFPYSSGPVMTIKGRGIVVRKSIEPAELAMLFGLVEVVQRISAAAPLRYLTQTEVAGLMSQGTSRYRELAIASRAGAGHS